MDSANSEWTQPIWNGPANQDFFGMDEAKFDFFGLELSPNWLDHVVREATLTLSESFVEVVIL